MVSRRCSNANRRRIGSGSGGTGCSGSGSSDEYGEVPDPQVIDRVNRMELGYVYLYASSSGKTIYDLRPNNSKILYHNQASNSDDVATRITPAWVVFFVCCMCTMLLLLYFFFNQLGRFNCFRFINIGSPISVWQLISYSVCHHRNVRLRHCDRNLRLLRATRYGIILSFPASDPTASQGQPRLRYNSHGAQVLQRN